MKPIKTVAIAAMMLAIGAGGAIAQQDGDVSAPGSLAGSSNASARSSAKAPYREWGIEVPNRPYPRLTPVPSGPSPYVSSGARNETGSAAQPDTTVSSFKGK
jgi:hypothetical protein